MKVYAFMFEESMFYFEDKEKRAREAESLSEGIESRCSFFKGDLMAELGWCCEDLRTIFGGLGNHKNIKFCPCCGEHVSQAIRDYMVKAMKA